MHRRVPLPPLALLSLALALAGCSSSSAPSGSGGHMGTVTFHLTDAPSGLQHVYLDINQVSIHAADSTMAEGAGGDGSWIVIPSTPGIHDLLELRNGVFTTIGTGQVPAGTYDQIRLKLGPDNTIVADSVAYPLKVPSGMASGYKLKGQFTVMPDVGVDVGIDFDAQRSIHQTGNGQWMLKPVARTFVIPLSGAIAGRVVPDSVVTTVYAIQAPDTVATTITDANGHFVLSLLPPGVYSVHFAPKRADFAPQAIEAVVVTAGHVTDMGVITLQPVVQPAVLVGRPAPIGPGVAARLRR